MAKHERRVQTMGKGENGASSSAKQNGRDVNILKLIIDDPFE